MGSSASIPSEQMDENSCRTFLGEKYDHELYEKLRGENVFITKEQLSKEIVKNALEDEVQAVYTLFCPRGDINGTVFKKFCADCKLLSKKTKFVALDADMFFKDQLSKNCMQHSMGYSPFRLIVLPALAKKKDMELEKLLDKIAHCPGPSITKLQKEKKQDITSEISIEESVSVAIEEPVEVFDSEGSRKYGNIENESAKVIQKKQRSNIAKEKAHVLFETISLGMNSIKSQPLKEVADDNCFNAFKMYANSNHQIDCMSYIHFLKDAGLINKKFTEIQADLIFERAKLLAKVSIDLNHGLHFGKRVEYDIFRSLIVAMIADKIEGLEPDDIMRKLGNIREKSFHDVTKVHGGK